MKIRPLVLAIGKLLIAFAWAILIESLGWLPCVCGWNIERGGDSEFTEGRDWASFTGVYQMSE